MLPRFFATAQNDIFAESVRLFEFFKDLLRRRPQHS